MKIALAQLRVIPGHPDENTKKMLEMKYKQNPKIPQNIRLKATTTIINIIPNGNNYENIEKTSFLKNGINKTRSKMAEGPSFLSYFWMIFK